MNPDGEQANRAWIKRWPSVDAFLRHVLREPPGRDVEFGFPAMRPENAAVTAFLVGRDARAPSRQPARDGLRRRGPRSSSSADWVTRTATAAERVQRVRRPRAGSMLHDEDRRGDKGFHYLGAGFATTPTGTAMRAHFRAAGDHDTAALFHDSSMEQVARAAPGPEAPLCLVTEVPLFRVSGGAVGRAALRARLPSLTMRAQRGAPVTGELARFGVEPVDPRVAIGLQLRAIELGLAGAEAA